MGKLNICLVPLRVERTPKRNTVNNAICDEKVQKGHETFTGFEIFIILVHRLKIFSFESSIKPYIEST